MEGEEEVRILFLPLSFSPKRKLATRSTASGVSAQPHEAWGAEARRRLIGTPGIVPGARLGPPRGRRNIAMRQSRNWLERIWRA